MIQLKFLFSCTLVAVIRLTEGANSTAVPFDMKNSTTGLVTKDILGPSLPNGTVYVPFNASVNLLALSIVNVSIYDADSLKQCYYQAVARGGHIFEWRDDSKCNIATLQFKLCRSKPGSVSVYILERFLTDGTSEDRSTVEYLQLGTFLYSILRNPRVKHGSFRIETPTLLDFPGYYAPPDVGSIQTILTANNSIVKANKFILADPACYTNSSCAVPFVYLQSKVPRRDVFLHDYCDQVLRVLPGEELNVLSHSKIGCEYFTTEKYTTDRCRVRFEASAPLRIKTTFVNFIGNDTCDGFFLGVVAYSSQDVFSSIRLCSTPTDVIQVPYGRGRIEFRGRAAKGRNKYGFILKLTHA